MPVQFVPGRVLAILCFVLGTSACAQAPADVASAAPSQAGCAATGEGSLQAQLRGALVADLAWQNAQMQCDGDQRPDGGIRITIAGPMPAEAAAGKPAGTPAQLRFIFGIDLHDAASGAAQALPTNLTVIVEGGKQLYATRGDDKCAIETLQRTPLRGSEGSLELVKVRGYCTAPASDLAGTARLLVPTFSFTALIGTGDEP